jgi:hypothetical protein
MWSRKNSCPDSPEARSFWKSAKKSPSAEKILTAKILRLDEEHQGFLSIEGLFGYQI